jgi:hypothetical protein
VPLAKVTQTGLAPKRERPGPGKCTAVLPGGGVMPLLALAVDATTTSEQLTAALQSGYRHMDCSPESNLVSVPPLPPYGSTLPPFSPTNYPSLLG